MDNWVVVHVKQQSEVAALRSTFPQASFGGAGNKTVMKAWGPARLNGVLHVVVAPQHLMKARFRGGGHVRATRASAVAAGNKDCLWIIDESSVTTEAGVRAVAELRTL